MIITFIKELRDNCATDICLFQVKWRNLYFQYFYFLQILQQGDIKFRGMIKPFNNMQKSYIIIACTDSFPRYQTKHKYPRKLSVQVRIILQIISCKRGCNTY